MTLGQGTDLDGAIDGASPVPAILAAICPHLLAEDGGWRSARPLREQRCTAQHPPGHLTLEKQRRLCLVDEHLRCPIYLDALEARAAARDVSPAALAEFQARVDRRVPRSAVVALDRPSSWTRSRPLTERLRGVSRVGLAGMMLAAVALLIVARFLGGGSLGPAATATPTSSLVANASPTLSPAPSATATPLPTLTPSPGPTATPLPSPTPAFSQTYTVKSGDTLGNIASRFGTTVAKLKALNGITNGDLIFIGEVLKIP